MYSFHFDKIKLIIFIFKRQVLIFTITINCQNTTTEDAFYIGYLIYTTSVFNHRGLRHPQKSFRYQRRLPRTVLECALILRRSRGRARLRMQ